MSMSQQRTKKKKFSGNLGWNGEEPLLVDNHVHVAAEDILQLHGNVHVDAAVRRLVREHQVGECLLLYTHITRQVSKRQGFKTSGFKTSETSGLQNVRFTKRQVT